MVNIRAAAGDADKQAVRALFQEYATSVTSDICFQGFAAELAGLPGDYAAPRGCLLLAEYEGVAVGCVGVRPIDTAVCEMKRLFVRRVARGLGAGRLLAEGAVVFGRAAGYRVMRLETLPDMKRAQKLYRHLGFAEIPSYRANPAEGAIYLELELAR
jgi:putative acetyltransferase